MGSQPLGAFTVGWGWAENRFSVHLLVCLCKCVCVCGWVRVCMHVCVAQTCSQTTFQSISSNGTGAVSCSLYCCLCQGAYTETHFRGLVGWQGRRRALDLLLGITLSMSSPLASLCLSITSYRLPHYFSLTIPLLTCGDVTLI